MKNTLKGIVIGVVLTLVLTGSFAIFADDIFEQISVLRNPSTITINGADMSGDHFEYLDRTYVPLREVCEKLGMDVVWDGEKGTIDITPSDTALIINGEKVSAQMTDAAKKQLNVYFAEQGQNPTAEQLEEQVYLYVTERYLVCQAAFKAGISLTEAETELVYAEVANLKQTLGEDVFARELTEIGYTEETYITLRLQIALGEKFKNSLGFTADDAAVRAYYDEHLVSLEQPYWVAKHILFSTEGMSESEANAVYKKAQSVLTKIQKGSDFDTLMKEYSEDPGLATNPEGYKFTAGQMVPEFEEATKNLSDNEVSGLVKTDYGYHIIKRIGSGITDSFESWKEAIRQQIINDCYADYVAGLRKEANIVKVK